MEYHTPEHRTINEEFAASAGICLIIGSLLFIATMVLHPSGGSVEHILKIARIAMISHSLAVLSVPFIAFGFLGVTRALETPHRISLLAFIISLFALVAVMIAATINGLTLPMFVTSYQADITQNPDAYSPVIRYGFAINKPMDFIFLIGLGLAMVLWSYQMTRGNIFPKWLGYYGLVLVVLAGIAVFTPFNFISVAGFRVIVFGIASWIIGVGVLLMRMKSRK